MPSTSVKLTEIVSKVVFEEHPPLAGLCGFKAALARMHAQHGWRHVQEGCRFVEVECAHALALVIAAHLSVVATRLELHFPIDVPRHALAERIVVVVLVQGVQKLA